MIAQKKCCITFRELGRMPNLKVVLKLVVEEELLQKMRKRVVSQPMETAWDYQMLSIIKSKELSTPLIRIGSE